MTTHYTVPSATSPSEPIPFSALPEKELIAFLADKKGIHARKLAKAALETEASETGAGELASSAVEDTLSDDEEDLYV